MRTDISEVTVLAAAGYQLRPGLNLGVALGAVLAGRLEPSGGEAADMEPGPALSVSLSWLALPETGTRPFLFAGATLGAVTAVAGADRVTALDARATLLLGKTFAQRLVVYAAARAFAGPVFWRDASGGDVHHYSFGAGVRVALPASLDLFVEGMPLGEQSATAGVGYAF